MEKLIERHVQKLGKLLVRFAPDLVHLHGGLESNGAHHNTVCSLNLSLPTVQLHAREEGGNLLTDLQACFNHIAEQVKKHKRALRREEAWKRRRPKRQISVRMESPQETEGVTPRKRQ
jgi:ribosome-associated translation inhibitor RaiA